MEFRREVCVGESDINGYIVVEVRRMKKVESDQRKYFWKREMRVSRRNKWLVVLNILKFEKDIFKYM